MKTDLKERCVGFSIWMIRFVGTLTDDRVSRIISDQLVCAATSIGANVIEAKSASSRRDFAKFYEIALKSGNETTYWLRLLKDVLNVDGTEVQELL